MKEVTDGVMFVKAKDNLVTWDKNKIINALIKETGLSKYIAERISNNVEIIVDKLGIKKISTTLIRELVNVELLKNNLYHIVEKHQRIGLPVHDVESLLVYPNKENANVPHGPEACNLNIAEIVNKEYALRKVFSDKVSEAHIKGDIHLHDLGFIQRPYCSGNNIAYIGKYGLNLTGAMSIAKPANKPEVLLAHIVKMSAALQGCFAGAIGWDAVNIFFAPYIKDLSYKEIKHLAQMLIFEYSQQAVARGGQAIFSDLNFYWEIPKHFKEVDAIGPGGKIVGKYKDYEKEAQQFAKAVFEIYLEGDATGKPFFFPKPLVHITEEFWKTTGHEEFLELLCKVSVEKGNTYYVFDRGNTAKISECCRLSFKLNNNDLEDAKKPWKLRFCALQNVTINLPRIGYISKDKQEVLDNIEKIFALVVKAHVDKKIFIDKLIENKNGPLSLLCMDLDGEKYLRINKLSYLVGMLGLNELVKIITKKEMHEDEESFLYGLSIINKLNNLCQYWNKTLGYNFVLEQTPAESTTYRFAQLDLKYYPKQSKEVIQGDITSNSIYYTNSTQFATKSDIHFIDRITKEGMFHPMIEAGSLSHIWLGEKTSNYKALSSLVKKIFHNTVNDQIAFSPEFTICNECNKLTKGLKEKCNFCGSHNVDGITRITGYFSKTSGWNKGKLAELKDRKKEDI